MLTVLFSQLCLLYYLWLFDTHIQWNTIHGSRYQQSDITRRYQLRHIFLKLQRLQQKVFLLAVNATQDAEHILCRVLLINSRNYSKKVALLFGEGANIKMNVAAKDLWRMSKTLLFNSACNKHT